MTNRVHIDAPAGIIDIEGEKDFVEGLLAKLFPLIEEAGFGSKALAASEVTANGTEEPELPSVAMPEETNTTKTRTRKAGKRTPAGQGAPARILTLKSEGFFQERKRTGEILAKMEERRWTHNISQVSAAAGNLVQAGKLQRIKEGESWLYYWDRD